MEWSGVIMGTAEPKGREGKGGWDRQGTETDGPGLRNCSRLRSTCGKAVTGRVAVESQRMSVASRWRSQHNEQQEERREQQGLAASRWSRC